MTKLKLTYFNIKARAEPIRLALAIQNIPFEDHRLTKEEWQNLKRNTTFGQVPILTVDGKEMAQSTAILRYVGKLGSPKLYPDDPWHAALVLNYVETELKKTPMESRIDLVKGRFAELFGDLDRFIGLHFDGFATGKDVTIADLFLYQMNTSYSSGAYDGIPSNVLEPFENIQKVVVAVKQLPAVVEWESRHK